MYLAFAIILLCAALFLVVAVLLQSSKDKGISGTISGGSSETYFGKNKGKSREKKLNTLTIVVAIIFTLIVLTVFVIQKEPVTTTLQ
ncbi:MAG: preprotein translocase subunit SecG [Clostridia bacterium]|nr:preprotein translocase subunit SecG [Clostridia bacterium]